MKTILTLFCALLFSVGLSQDLAFAKTTNHSNSFGYHQDYVPKIDLKLPQQRYIDRSTKKEGFAVLLIAGLAFTTASILEGDAMYSTYKNTGPYTQTYVTKPFWQQTPRQIMLCVGVGLTLTGTIGLASK